MTDASDMPAAAPGMGNPPAPSDTDPGMGNHPAPSDLASLEQKIRDLARPRPLYTPESVHAAHALSYDWTGWLSDNAPFPPQTPAAVHAAAPLWERDGLLLETCSTRKDLLQILFRAGPPVSPVRFARIVKGRLQHALRGEGAAVRFSRKVAVRTLGSNIRQAVQGYLRKQVRKEKFADPRYAARMAQYTVEDEAVDLSQPTATVSGRYWYNLHLVIVAGGRRRIADESIFVQIRDACPRIAAKKDCRLRGVSVMPDHLHVAMRGNPELSPEDIALGFLNNLAFVLGRNRVWADGYYVGTFSEYEAEAITGRSRSPATQGRGGRRP